MKHNPQVTLLIVAIFLFTQIFGLFLLGENIVKIEKVGAEINIKYSETSIGEPPEMNPKESFFFILTSVLIGTVLVLLIIKFGKTGLWKTWFFFAVFIAVSISLGVIMHWIAAYILAFILTFIKIRKKSIWTHNITEILMYAGISILIVPMFQHKSSIVWQDGLFWVFVLLIVISIYDMYAVWKSKHMVKMAQFQTKSKLFAGLMIPYDPKKKRIHLKELKGLNQTTKIKKQSSMKNAILGGGDVAFPLIFSGVVMNHLILNGLSISTAFLQSIIVSVTVALSLWGLFVYSKKDRFYPAMPFVTIGCVVGYCIILLL